MKYADTLNILGTDLLIPVNIPLIIDAAEIPIDSPVTETPFFTPTATPTSSPVAETSFETLDTPPPTPSPVVKTAGVEETPASDLDKKAKKDIVVQKPPSTALLILHRCCLVLIIILHIISFIPPLRMAGALALRGLVFLDLLAQSPANKEWRTWKGFLGLMVKCIGLALGIVGIILSLMPLFAASFGLDIVLQLKGMWNCLRDEKNHIGRKIGLFLLHLSLIIVDSLALAAIITGGWELAAAAAFVSAVVIGGLAAYFTGLWWNLPKEGKAKAEVGFEACCYFILSLLNFVTVFSIMPFDGSQKRAKVTVKNDSTDKEMTVKDANETLLDTLHPGETKTIDVEIFNNVVKPSFHAQYDGELGFLPLDNVTTTYNQSVQLSPAISPGDIPYLPTAVINSVAVTTVNIVPDTIKQDIKYKRELSYSA